MATELTALKKKIESKSPSDRLRLAAALLEHGHYSMAEAIANTVVQELQTSI